MPKFAASWSEVRVALGIPTLVAAVWRETSLWRAVPLTLERLGVQKP